MTEEDKKLLFKDLCARLPYRPKVGVITFPLFRHPHWRLEDDLNDIRELNLNVLYCNGVEYVVPYLRPLESMTEKEKKEYWKHGGIDQFDYLNSIHVDYRDLIPMGLALPAKKGMYNFD